MQARYKAKQTVSAGIVRCAAARGPPTTGIQNGAELARMQSCHKEEKWEAFKRLELPNKSSLY